MDNGIRHLLFLRRKETTKAGYDTGLHIHQTSSTKPKHQSYMNSRLMGKLKITIDTGLQTSRQALKSDLKRYVTSKLIENLKISNLSNKAKQYIHHNDFLIFFDQCNKRGFLLF